MFIRGFSKTAGSWDKLKTKALDSFKNYLRKRLGAPGAQEEILNKAKQIDKDPVVRKLFKNKSSK